jgi:hypothetical protein
LVDTLLHFDPTVPNVTTLSYFKDPESMTTYNSTYYAYEKKDPKKVYEDALKNLFHGDINTSFQIQDAIQQELASTLSE